VLIPKPGTGEMRPLSIPAVRDRIVQAALKIVLEPVFEADFLSCSFGFRPRRSAHDALQVLIDECWRRDDRMMALKFGSASSLSNPHRFAGRCARCRLKCPGLSAGFGALEPVAGDVVGEVAD
jgi:hypothetical protein